MKQKPPSRQQSRRLVVLLLLALLTACCARTAPVAYYQLAAMDGADLPGAPRGIGDRVIGIGPVRMPELLDRPQIVTRLDANRLHLADDHRWAEPLADSFIRVLRENLFLLLDTERILIHPWSAAAPPDYQVIAEVIRLEGDAAGAVHLETVWSIKNREGKILLPQRRGSYQAQAAGPDYDATVAAMSETVALLSRDVARHLSLAAQEGQAEKERR